MMDEVALPQDFTSQATRLCQVLEVYKLTVADKLIFYSSRFVDCIRRLEKQNDQRKGALELLEVALSVS
jgi:hypothetical protein